MTDEEFDKEVKDTVTAAYASGVEDGSAATTLAVLLLAREVRELRTDFMWIMAQILESTRGG